MNIKQIPINGILTDFIIIAITLIIKPFSWWVMANFILILLSIGLLQAVTVYVVMLNFSFSDQYIERLPNFISNPRNLFVILAFGGFIWLFLPAIAINNNALWIISSLTAFFAFFGSLIGYKLTKDREDNKDTFINKAIALIIPPIYLSISEILILSTSYSTGTGPGLAIFAIAISYLPIRILMVVSPPNSKIEWLTASLAFSFFIYSLF